MCSPDAYGLSLERRGQKALRPSILANKNATFLKLLLARVSAGVAAVTAATRRGALRVDDKLNLSVLPAEDEDPEVTKLRAALDHPSRYGHCGQGL